MSRLLALGLVFCLSACGDKADGDSAGSVSDTGGAPAARVAIG